MSYSAKGIVSLFVTWKIRALFSSNTNVSRTEELTPALKVLRLYGTKNFI